jgi:hypothetical protein
MSGSLRAVRQVLHERSSLVP